MAIAVKTNGPAALLKLGFTETELADLAKVGVSVKLTASAFEFSDLGNLDAPACAVPVTLDELILLKSDKLLKQRRS